MESSDQEKFDKQYQCHLRNLILQGKSQKTIDSYSRAVRRLSHHYNCCLDVLTQDQLKDYFTALVDSHSWSTVKIDRLGLQFFWKHTLKIDWQWIEIVKPPKVKSIPDIFTPNEIERIIGATYKLRFRVFILTTYSMGLRLDETLSLQVGDIDGERKMVHIRRGKGHKDRMVPLPDLTYLALRALWCKHRNPVWLFPNANGSMERIGKATSHMHCGGPQQAMKAVVKQCGIKKKLLSIVYATALQHICLNAA